MPSWNMLAFLRQTAAFRWETFLMFVRLHYKQKVDASKNVQAARARTDNFKQIADPGFLSNLTWRSNASVFVNLRLQH
jgi:hypothetical protein